MVNNNKNTKLYFSFLQLLRWIGLILPMSVVVGSIVAFFLWSLDLVTFTRGVHPQLVYLLPFAGVLIYFLYARFGKNSGAGNNLIIDEIHEPAGRIPLRMAPLVFVSTILTHLFGGSAGREGTAVQIGGSIANGLTKLIDIRKEDLSVLLKAGVAAGFGAVFGTPFAGAIFALEVVAIGKIKMNALIPCLFAGWMAHLTCVWWGIGHTDYSIQFFEDLMLFNFDPLFFLKIVVAGILFGLASLLFSSMSHFTKNFVHRSIKQKWMVPFIGGVVLIVLSMLFGSDYLGLGVESFEKNDVSIVSSFSEGGASVFSWLLKLIFTVVTLSFGFKGGEVTPLFFIGATLGNTLALAMGVPVDLLAGIGFVAVFAGATNTPVASAIMGIELFGYEFALYFIVACFMSYFVSGSTGIYKSQRKEVSKLFRKKIEK